MGFTGDFTVGEVGERDRKNRFREMLVEITYPEPGVRIGQLSLCVCYNVCSTILYICLFPFLNYFASVLVSMVVFFVYFYSQRCKLEKQNRHNFCRLIFMFSQVLLLKMYLQEGFTIKKQRESLPLTYSL